jgi:hypothetical protein
MNQVGKLSVIVDYQNRRQTFTEGRAKKESSSFLRGVHAPRGSVRIAPFLNNDVVGIIDQHANIRTYFVGTQA